MWEAIVGNRRRSLFLILGLAALLVALGYVAGLAIDPRAGPIGAGVGVFIWLVLWLTATLGGREVLLGSVGAREIRRDDSPVLFNVVEEMTIAAGLPKPPRVYVMDSDAPNAFAVGSEDNSAVAVTTGLMMRLNRDELQGVVGHEVGHIKNHDTRFMTHAGVMLAAIVLLSDAFLRTMFYSGRGSRRSSRRGGGGGGAAIVIVIALLLAILAPLLAQVLYFACSRRREYLADACSARFTRYPEGLASALEKISRSAAQMQNVNRAVAPMFTVSPLKGSAAHSVFSTHPPTEERVRVLRAMAGGAAYSDYEAAYSRVSGGHLIGQRTLADSERVAVREASAEPEKEDLAKAREAVDILHRLGGFLLMRCACGWKIKVPPAYKGSHVRCPGCGKQIAIPTAVFAAAAAAAGEAGDVEAGTEGREVPPPVFRHRSGQWESFRCRCGETVQLSPSFSAPAVQCRACGQTTKVEPI